MQQLIRYLIWFLPLFAGFNLQAQNNTVYGAGISYTNGVPSWVPNPRTSRAAVDTVTGRWYHFNTPGGWQWIGNTVEEIAGCAAPAYTPGKGDSRLVINNCVKPQVYWYDGAAWKWINEGTTYFAGEGIRIENDTIILDSLNFLYFRTGSALDGDVGRVQWNDTDGTLDLNLKGGNVTLQIGQEEVSLVKNADNSGLIEGRVVYIVGSDGTNKTVRYAKADSDATSATTFGLMTESATGGNKAFCTTLGLVRNLNTTNLTEGGIVWLSADTAGTMTAVRPTAPDHGVMIGFCIRKHATQGAIFVQVQNGYELNELHDVFVPSPTNGQVLTWNSTNARWEAITPANQLQTLSTNGSAGNISISSGNTITLNVNDADASATNELQTLSVAANTATLSNSGGSVTIAGAGINTVGTAGTTITVTGTEVDGSTTNELQTLSTGTNTLTLSNSGGTVTVDTDPSTDVTGSGTSGQVSFWTGAQTQGGDNGLFWNNTDKRLGVGTNAPTRQLTVAEDALINNRQIGLGTGNVVSNTFLSAGVGPNFTGSHTVAIGSMTLPNITTATGTILIGSGAGNNITTGGSNTYIGRDAGAANQTATVNFGLGAFALLNHNTGNANIAIGFDAARRIDGGANMTGSSGSIYIGNDTRPLANAQSNQIIIGDGAIGLGSNTTRIGNSSTTQTWLGGSLTLGTQVPPAARLHVVGSGASSTTWTAQFHNSAGNNNALMIRDDGRVGVGTTTMTGAFNVNSSGGWNIYTTGTSNNYMSTKLGIGATDLSSSILRIGSNLTGSVAPAHINITGEVQSDVTIAAAGINCRYGTAAGFNLPLLTCYAAQQGIFNGTVTDQFGFNAANNLIGASNNYGFYGNIPAGTGRWNFYANGTARNYFAGNTAIGTTAQNASAVFEVASTTQGVLFPRMTTAQRDLIATPADGLVIYNTTDNKLQVRAAGAWVDLH